MKIKNIISGILMFTLLAAAPTHIRTSFTAKAAADGGFTAEQIEASPVKPTLSVSKTALSASEAPSSIQTVTISLKGAAEKYNSTGFHVYFDKRLTLIANQWGAAADKGEAISYLNTESYCKNNCLFLTTAGRKGDGMDGVMWSFRLKLPENAENGDFYPISIVYENGTRTEDVFINDMTDNDSRLMQAWVFTKGIENGYIQVGDYTAGDANCSGEVDLSDAVLIMQCVSNPDKFSLSGTAGSRITDQGYKNADVFAVGDGVTSKDALAIQKYMLKLIPSLPES